MTGPIRTDHDRDTPAPWVFALIALGCVGYFKGSPLLAAVPGDLTVELAVVVAAGIAAHLLSRRRYDGVAAARIIVLFLTFAPAAALAVVPAKAAELYSVTLICAITPVLFLIDQGARRLWLIGTVLLAVLMTVAALLFPDAESRSLYGRIALSGSDTIGTGRVIGAGIVVTAFVALTHRRFRIPLWVASAAGTVMLVAV